MKIAYIAAFDRKRDIGIYHKITDQIQALRYLGTEVRLVQVKCQAVQIQVGKHEFTDVRHNWKDIRIRPDVDALYIRYPKSDMDFIQFIRRFKQERSNRTIVIELPTYPYGGEDCLDNIIPSVKDRMFRQMLRYYVDRFITYSYETEIFHVKTLRTINGINFAQVKPKQIIPKADDSIDIIAVASMKSWHAYEELIEGMGRYYQSGGKHLVRLHLVGTGPEIPKYKSMTQKYKLGQKVIFHGQQDGEKLDEIYDMCDIGAIVFSVKRKGIPVFSPIKAREYAAKGIPMFLVGKIDVFPADKYPFILEIKEDECPVQVPKIIEWYDNLLRIYGSKENMVEKIRDISAPKCDSKVVMKPIYRYMLMRTEGRK